MKNRKHSTLLKALATMALLLGLLLICFVVMTYITDRQLEQSGAVVWSGDQELDRHNVHGVEEKIRLPCFNELTFKSNKLEQKVNIHNSEYNECDMAITLSVDGKIVWNSMKIEPGFGFYEISLLHVFSPGIYNGNCKIECFSKDGRQLNGANFDFTLYVE